MKKMLNYMVYDVYLIILLTLTFFSFTGHIQEYLMPLLIGIGVVMIVAKKSIFYLIPIPIFIQMSFSGLRDNVEVTTIYSIIFAVMILFDVILNRKLTKKGYLTLPLLILLGVSVLTHINSPDLFTTFAGFTQILTVVVLYLYFINTIEKDNNNFDNAAKLLMYIGILVSLEMMWVVYESGDHAIEIIQRRRIDLGWENLNVIIYANLVAIPLIGYLITKVRVKVPYMIGLILVSIGILLTLSRSSIFTLGVFFALMVPFMFIFDRNRKLLVLEGGFYLVLLLILVQYLENNYTLFSDYIIAFRDRDLFNADNRIVLWEIGWEQLKMHPIIGSGGLYSSRIHLLEYGAKNYHNTIIQASSLGSIGLIGFAFLFFRKTKMIMLSKSSFKWFALIMIYVTTFVNGSLQPMYFYTTYMVFVFLVLAIIEIEDNGLPKSNKEK